LFVERKGREEAEQRVQELAAAQQQSTQAARSGEAPTADQTCPQACEFRAKRERFSLLQTVSDSPLSIDVLIAQWPA